MLSYLAENTVIYASPKQSLDFIFEVTNANNIRVDSPTLPMVNKIFKPDFSLLDGYPASMTKIDTGLYSFTLTLPIGLSNVGSFIVDIAWTNPDNLMTNKTFYQIISRLPPNAAGTYIAIN